jgi:hypothetical protein
MRLVLMLLILLCAALPARELHVTSDGANQATVARLQAQVEIAFDIIYEKTSLHDEGPVRLHVVGGMTAFERAANADGVSMRGENILGYAVPSQRRVVLNLAAVAQRGFDPIGVLRHELAHLAMGSLLRVSRPLWFEEGVCQYVESVPLNLLLEGAGPASFATFESLDDLSASLRDENRAGPAYAEAREAVRLLVERHGQEAFFAFMGKLELGEGPFEAAFEASFNEPLAAFETAWLEDQEARKASRWTAFFGGVFWLIPLAIAALILPMVWLLRRGRGKSQVEVWEEQEKYFPSDPSWSYAQDDESWRGNDS